MWSYNARCLDKRKSSDSWGVFQNCINIHITRPFITNIAFAVIANWLINARSVFVTIISLILALIFIITADCTWIGRCWLTIASVTSVTNTVITTLCINTVGIFMASVRSNNTLINILTRGSNCLKACITFLKIQLCRRPFQFRFLLLCSEHKGSGRLRNHCHIYIQHRWSYWLHQVCHQI